MTSILHERRCAAEMRLQFEHFVAAPIDAVFRFHQRPANLTRLLARWPAFRLLRHEPRVRIGGQLWVQETVLGLPVALGFVHTLCDSPRRLGHDLIHGPFSRFSHLHEFMPCRGGTRIRDTLDIGLPWCFGGSVMLRALVVPLLRRAFAIRITELAALARSGGLADGPA